MSVPECVNLFSASRFVSYRYPFLSVILIGWAYVVPPIVLTCIYALVVVALYRRRRPTKLLYKNASRHPLADVDDISFDNHNSLLHTEIHTPSEEVKFLNSQRTLPAYNNSAKHDQEDISIHFSTKSDPTPKGCTLPVCNDFHHHNHHLSQQPLSPTSVTTTPHLHIWMTPAYFNSKKVPLQRQSVSVTVVPPPQLSHEAAPNLSRPGSMRKFSYAAAPVRNLSNDKLEKDTKKGKYHSSILPDPVTVAGHFSNKTDFTSNEVDGDDTQTTLALLRRFKAAFLRADANTRRAVRSVIILCTIFLLLWLSTGILSPPIIWCYYYAPADACDLKLLYKLVVIASYVLYMTALLNPVLYALAFPKIRAAVLRFILPYSIYYRLPERCLGRREERMRKRIMSRQFSVKPKLRNGKLRSKLNEHVYPGAAFYQEENKEYLALSSKNGPTERRNSLFEKPSPLNIPGLPVIEIEEPPNTVPLTERSVHRVRSGGSHRRNTRDFGQSKSTELNGSCNSVPCGRKQSKRVSLPITSIAFAPECATNNLLSNDRKKPISRSYSQNAQVPVHDIIVELINESDETNV